MNKMQVTENGLTYEVKVNENGTKEWRLNGQRHREDGPAMEYANGSKYWYKNGQLHREDGPAVEWADGTKFWYKNGQRHREDGPAAEYADGSKYWYLNGQEYTKAQFKAFFTITLFSGRKQNLHEKKC